MSKEQKGNSSKLEDLRTEAFAGGGPAQIDKQHAKGKMTARERIARLLDSDTFVETDMFVVHRSTSLGMNKSHPLTDGVVTGWGKIDGRLVYVFAQDFTILGGSLGESHGQKISRVMDLAYQNGAPLIGINDSGGARIQEGVDSLAAYGEIFRRNVRASGVIPQISVILGPCAGGAVYSPALTDFVFMSDKNSYMFITGPEVIRQVTGEIVDFESLGDARIHHGRSGVVHITGTDEENTLDQVRTLLSFIPSNNLTPPPYLTPTDDPNRLVPELSEIVPADPQRPYNIHDVLESLMDNGEFFEVQRDYAANLVVGFGRMDGYTVGVVANQPAYLAGVLDINASDKGARFIRFCDAYHIPLVTLVDTPGFLPGVQQEYDGVIRHGAKLIYAYAEASVPKVSIILRKAYGGAYIVMSSKHLDGDLNYAWPQAEIAVMGPEGAVQIVYRKELADATDPKKVQEEYTRQYRSELANPFVAAGRGFIDNVIDPESSRMCLIQSLAALRNKRVQTPNRKHGNIPL